MQYCEVGLFLFILELNIPFLGNIHPFFVAPDEKSGSTSTGAKISVYINLVMFLLRQQDKKKK
jgi:hypothetical protein